MFSCPGGWGRLHRHRNGYRGLDRHSMGSAEESHGHAASRKRNHPAILSCVRGAPGNMDRVCSDGEGGYGVAIRNRSACSVPSGRCGDRTFPAQPSPVLRRRNEDEPATTPIPRRAMRKHTFVGRVLRTAGSFSLSSSAEASQAHPSRSHDER